MQQKAFHINFSFSNINVLLLLLLVLIPPHSAVPFDCFFFLHYPACSCHSKLLTRHAQSIHWPRLHCRKVTMKTLGQSWIKNDGKSWQWMFHLSRDLQFAPINTAVGILKGVREVSLSLWPFSISKQSARIFGAVWKWIWSLLFGFLFDNHILRSWRTLRFKMWNLKFIRNFLLALMAWMAIWYPPPPNFQLATLHLSLKICGLIFSA